MILNTDIDGFECEYSLFLIEQREYLKRLCNKYSKYMSGSSNYHADFKPEVKMGTGINNNLNIEIYLVERWINR